MKGGGLTEECYCFLRNVQDLLADGKTPCERRFEESFKGPIIPFRAMVEYHPTSLKDQARIHQFGKKVLPGIFVDYELMAGGIWKGGILVADMEDLEMFDASDSYPRRINAKEILIRHKMMNPYSHLQMVQQNYQEETKNSWNALSQAEANRSDRRFQQNFMMNRESQPTETTDDAEARADFWSIQGDFIYRLQIEPRVQLTLRAGGKTFPIALNYIDVSYKVYEYQSGGATRKTY